MAIAPSQPYEGMSSSSIDNANPITRTANPSIKATRPGSIYRGFSTQGSFGRNFTLTNKQLVMRDLENHIYTIPGERPGRPDFGTVIPMMAFEGATEETLNLIERELRRVFAADPRVELVKLIVMALPENNAVTAVCDLKYIELDSMLDTMQFTFGQG